MYVTRIFYLSFTFTRIHTLSLFISVIIEQSNAPVFQIGPADNISDCIWRAQCNRYENPHIFPNLRQTELSDFRQNRIQIVLSAILFRFLFIRQIALLRVYLLCFTHLDTRYLQTQKTKCHTKNPLTTNKYNNKLMTSAKIAPPRIRLFKSSQVWQRNDTTYLTLREATKKKDTFAAKNPKSLAARITCLFVHTALRLSALEL